MENKEPYIYVESNQERAVVEIGLGWVVSFLIALAVLAGIALCVARAHAATTSKSTRQASDLVRLMPEDNVLHYQYLAGLVEAVYVTEDDVTRVVMHDATKPMLQDLARVTLCGGEETADRFQTLVHTTALVVYTRAQQSKRTGCRNAVFVYHIQLPDGFELGIPESEITK